MNVRKIKIDKTAKIEALLPDYLIICLSGLPGIGRKTAVRMLLDRHTEVNGIFCFVEEIEDGSVLEKREAGRPNWYLIRKPEGCRYPDSNAGLWRFVERMPREDRIILAIDGLLPQNLLEFVWNGIMALVQPETFWFSEAETYCYLRECKSELRYREVYYLTGGWAGCIAMLVRLEKQLRDKWTVWELCSRYEIRNYIQKEILGVLPEDELRMLQERAAFPNLTEELVSELWDDPGKELEERLFQRGAMIYVAEKHSWHVQPALRMAMELYTSPELYRKAIFWYERKGQIQDALTCCWYLHDRELYRECLVRNYDRIPFLNYERIERVAENPDEPELFYLKWMEQYFRQDAGSMKGMREKVVEQMRLRAAERLSSYALAGKEREILPADPDRKKETEILLNMAYADPAVTAKAWMELLRDNTKPGQPVRLYFMLGESVSYLSGLRDLSELFSCGKKERAEHRKLWEERLAPENQLPYRLAELEYEFLTDGAIIRNANKVELLPEIDENASWQIRLGMMYLAYLFASDDEMQKHVQGYIRRLAESLEKEDIPVCRWNAKALYYLAQMKWGEKEGLMKWIRETGGDIGNDTGKTRFHMAAEVKINLYLGNYSRAETVLQVLIPYFEKNHNWRWLAESLFQRALIEKEKGETGQALKMIAESMTTANPYRYVRIYTGYGKRGVELLEEYRSWMEKTETGYRQNKKKYKYGSVLRMPISDWLGYIMRRAGREKKNYPDLQEEQQNIYRVEKLTVTEQMVLQYLEKGCSNAEISRNMNIKLPTVKSHIYNIYKKLGVTARIQAVQKARESGIL